MCKVSIVLPCYNHGEYVEDAIKSILNQTYTDYELFIFDNGSTDNSWEVINKFEDHRITKIRLNKNSILKVKEQFIEKARGKYFAIMHSDDVWLEDKLEKQMELFDKNKDVRVSFTWSEFVDEQFNPIGLRFDECNKSQKGWWDSFFTGENHMSMPSFMCEREIYIKHLGCLYPYRQIADYYMWMKILEETNIYMVEQVLVKQRIHNSGKGNMNESYRTNENITRTAVEFKLMMFKLLDEMEDKTFVDYLCNNNIDDNYTHLDVMCEKFLFMLNGEKPFLKDSDYAIWYYNKYFDYIENNNIFYQYLDDKYKFSRQDFFDLTGKVNVTRDEDLSSARWAKMANIDFSTIDYPKELFIYGCGQIGKIFYKKIRKYCSVKQFIDRNPRRSFYEGVPITKIEDAQLGEGSVIIVVPTYDFDIIVKDITDEHPALKIGNIIRFGEFIEKGKVIDPEF